MSILDQQWKTLGKRPVASVLDSVREYMALGADRVVHIGTDSQKRGRHNDFVTAVVLLNPGKGGICFYTKSRVPHVNSLQYELFTEVSLSIEIALALCDVVDPKCVEVHVDANTNMKWESGPFHQRLAGMVTANGFKAVLKPDAWCASHVADHAANGKNDAVKAKRTRRKKAHRRKR